MWIFKQLSKALTRLRRLVWASLIARITLFEISCRSWERSGSMEKTLTQDRGATGKSHTGVTALYPWARHINPSLVLVQPRKIGPFITERLLMGRKESNQTSKNHVIAYFMYLLGQDTTIYIYPYLSWLTLPPFIFQTDIYIADLFFFML